MGTRLVVAVIIAVSLQTGAGLAQAPQAALDEKVKQFLDARRGTWRDLNVPEADGKALHDVIVERGVKRAVEIGTSTGLSGIWTAWGLSRTGGNC